MKKIYIVTDGCYIYGIFKSKDNAITEKRMRRVNGKIKGISIKYRVNRYGYKTDD